MRIRRILDALAGNRFSAKECGIFEPIYRSLLDHDHYLHIADFTSYVDAQDLVSQVYADKASWSSKAILNVARMGKFSSDRSIQEYANDIWGIQAFPRTDAVAFAFVATMLLQAQDAPLEKKAGPVMEGLLSSFSVPWGDLLKKAHESERRNLLSGLGVGWT